MVGESCSLCVHINISCEVFFFAHGYKWYFNRSIWPTDEILTCTITLNQSGLGSNGNDGIVFLHRSSELEPYNRMLFSGITRTPLLRVGFYPSPGNTASVFLALWTKEYNIIYNIVNESCIVKYLFKYFSFVYKNFIIFVFYSFYFHCKHYKQKDCSLMLAKQLT